MVDKKRILRTFELSGIILKSDVADCLCELLEPLPPEEHKSWIREVIDALLKMPINILYITKDDILMAAQDAGGMLSVDPDSVLEVIDVFKIPKISYNKDKRKYDVEKPKTITLRGTPLDKAAMLRNRYNIIYQRTLDHEAFRPPVFNYPDKASQFYSLKKVEFLLCSSSRVENVLVLGLLTSLVEAKYHLEDDTGHVELDISSAKFHLGLFTLNCFVLVEGYYDDNVLHAQAIGMPPAESATQTRSRMTIHNVNYFGGSATKTIKSNQKLLQFEEEKTDAMIVVLSDVWLDKLEVLEKLRVLFRGFESTPPVAFILCGNFFSDWQIRKKFDEMQRAFGALGSLIAEFPQLVNNSRFIFIPGPTDPGPSSIFPRPPLFKCVTEPLRKSVPSACFATNPCRIVYCTQEIVVIREDIISKMCRNSVHFPKDCDLAPHVARTLVNQCHLVPLPLYILPVFWTLDHCMWLQPTPDIVIIADKDKPFNTTYNEAKIFNPGSFFSSNYSFQVYFPSTRLVENSQLNEEESL